MSKALVLLLSGKQGSGKTTLQRALKDAFERRPSSLVLFVNFADVLYEIHNAIDGILGKYDETLTLRGRGLVKDGPLLQYLGTDWGRKSLGENVWVNLARKKVERLIADNSHVSSLLVVMGDTRFENEFDAFPDALRVRLRCDEEIRKARCSMWRDNTNHPSEIALDGYASENKFDLYFDTGRQTTGECVQELLAELNKRMEHS